jgi:hypothetical protein
LRFHSSPSLNAREPLPQRHDLCASPSLAQPEEGELRRQWLLARQLSEALGGCVPAEQVELARVHTALHVAWGIGRWALELAYTAPWIQVTSIESSPQSLDFAQRLTQKGGLSNVSFLLHDLRSLETVAERFAPQSIDLLHPAALKGTRSLSWLGKYRCENRTLPVDTTHSPLAQGAGEELPEEKHNRKHLRSSLGENLILADIARREVDENRQWKHESPPAHVPQ